MKKSFKTKATFVTKVATVCVLFFSSCSKKYLVHNSLDACACNCSNPQFVSSEFVSVATAGGQENLTLAVLLKTAKDRQGYDVSIQNVRWDIKKGKRISAIFDVVRCKKEK